MLLSALYDVDVGYGGLAGVAAFVVASGLVKKICVKDQDVSGQCYYSPSFNNPLSTNQRAE